MTLREPPKSPQAATLLGRLVGLLVMLALFALVVWTATTNQQAAAIQRSDPFLNPPGEHVVVRELVLHVRTFGAGRDIVLVHDDSIAGSAPLVALAEDLAEEGRRVIVPDLVGFGLSSRPPEPGRIYSSTGQAETLAALLDELGVGGADVVGLGWGGEVAVELAFARPDLVTSLALVDTPSLPVPTTGWETAAGLPFGVGEAVAYTFEGAAVSAAQSFVDECPVGGDCEDPEVQVAYARAAEVPGTARSIWARRATETAAVAPTRLEEVAAPVAVVVIAGDRQAAEDLAGGFPSAEVISATRSNLAEVLAGA